MIDDDSLIELSNSFPGEKNQKLYASIEPLGLDVERDQLSTSSNGSIMSATTGECFSHFNGYQSTIMDAFICSMSDQTLLKSEGNISNISSENEHSSISNSSVIDETMSMNDDGDLISVEPQKDLIMLLSGNSDDRDDRENARKVIELDSGERLVYHGMFEHTKFTSLNSPLDLTILDVSIRQ